MQPPADCRINKVKLADELDPCNANTKALPALFYFFGFLRSRRFLLLFITVVVMY
jgi:hypothetical protein